MFDPFASGRRCRSTHGVTLRGFGALDGAIWSARLTQSPRGSPSSAALQRRARLSGNLNRFLGEPDERSFPGIRRLSPHLSPRRRLDAGTFRGVALCDNNYEMTEYYPLAQE